MEILEESVASRTNYGRMKWRDATGLYSNYKVGTILRIQERLYPTFVRPVIPMM